MLRIFDNTDTLLTALADFIVDSARQAIHKHGRFSFVLSGGSSPKKLYTLLASDAYRSKIDWTRVFFFFGDERYVPATHADSNYRMAQETLFTPLNITPGQVFRMNTDLAVDAAAEGYEQDIRGYFVEKPICFDFILLGLGDNSHTASLFPHTSVLHEKEALVKGLYIDEVKMNRITLTAPVINRGAIIAFLVYGGGKAEAIHHILEDARNIEEYPAQLIHPEKGEIVWFLDEPAAANLSVDLKKRN
jgi:6-phosphogluconolactonase